MTNDIEAIESISSLSNGKTIGGELGFTFPEVLEAISQCTANKVAVLGVEIFRVKADSYETAKMSGYELPDQDWPEYVNANNALAEDFVKTNPAGDQHIYVLTTSSWREFCKIQEVKRSWSGN
jgi:hypothetical protein